MTTLHGSASDLWRCVKGCVLLEGMIAFARDPWKHVIFFLEPPWPYRMSLDPLIRISSSHMGAFESLQSCLSHYLDLVFCFVFVSSWERSEIGMSLGIGWITSCLIALDSFSHLMSLTCFLPRVFVSISWLDTSFHFILTYLMLWDKFIDHDRLFISYTYHGPRISFFVRSLIQFSIRCSQFHYGKVKDTFSYSHFFLEIHLDRLIIFSLYGAWVEGWVKDT